MGRLRPPGTDRSGRSGCAPNWRAFQVPEEGAGDRPDTERMAQAQRNAAVGARISRRSAAGERNWTRDEEMTWAYFRRAARSRPAGSAAPDGTITEWEFHNYNSGPSGLQSPYQIPVKKEQYHQSKSPLRQGSYRGLAATANHFVRESYMDELAESVKMDPLDFRLKNAKDERLRAVIVAASDKFDWKARKKMAGRGFGLAAGFEKGGYVATCAEVSVDAKTGGVKVLRAVVAFECGAVVNPEQRIRKARSYGWGRAVRGD